MAVDPHTLFQGTMPALVTPFTSTGEVDETTLRKLIQRQIEAGVDGLVPCGTTGESPTLTHEEHDRVIEITVEEARKAGRKVPVIAGTGSNATAEAVRLTKHAKEVGADACLLMNPYYNKPTQEGMYRHFMKVADEGGLPICLYNIPGRCGVKLEAETIARLHQHPLIQALKEATGSMDEASAVASSCNIIIMSGDDSMTLPYMAIGGRGVISVLANLFPNEVLKLTQAALQNRWDDARRQHLRLFRLGKGLLTLETNPIPIKTAMAMRGLLAESFRLPMCPMSEANKTKLVAILKEF